VPRTIVHPRLSTTYVFGADLPWHAIDDRLVLKMLAPSLLGTSEDISQSKNSDLLLAT